MTLEELIGKAIRTPSETLTDASGPGTLKRWDSLKHIQIVVSLEERYGVKFASGEIEKLKTIGQIKDVLRGKGVTV